MIFYFKLSRTPTLGSFEHIYAADYVADCTRGFTSTLLIDRTFTMRSEIGKENLHSTILEERANKLIAVATKFENYRDRAIVAAEKYCTSYIGYYVVLINCIFIKNIND